MTITPPLWLHDHKLNILQLACICNTYSILRDHNLQSSWLAFNKQSHLGKLDSLNNHMINLMKMWFA